MADTGRLLRLPDVPPGEAIEHYPVVGMTQYGVQEDDGRLWANLGIYADQGVTRLAVGESHTIPGVGEITVLDAHQACQGSRGMVKAEVKLRFEATEMTEP
ncbi:MAG: hypothetical protein FWE61_00800 [Micrococcales bacterium]|nr:hypothetical protein [Micrococcales bacterium]